MDTGAGGTAVSPADSGYRNGAERGKRASTRLVHERGRAGRGRPRPARPSLPESQRTSETRALSSRKMMMVMLKAIMNVEIALISGVMPMRTIDQICSGSVL